MKLNHIYYVNNYEYRWAKEVIDFDRFGLETYLNKTGANKLLTDIFT